MSKVFLALQDNDEARPIVEAIVRDNPAAVVDQQPAMVRITAEGKLVINRDTVREIKDDPDWEPQDVQLVLISFGGHLDEEDDHFTIYWND
ncbi:MmoB/DmpM family protein [Profundibacter sp.]|uniref:MmoB/DmpM family protein n=1 Tax=Profundibacter sp. TaxID=3101071 RepID=UPI003D0CF056